MIEEQLVTPPVRTPLMEEGGHEPKAKTATRDWWLYWNQLTLRGNQNAADIDKLEGDVDGLRNQVAALDDEVALLVRQGTHAARLATLPSPADALWVETDRNNLVYQARHAAGAAAWVYVTGAMHGTILAADERPPDLGANDAGLIFLSSDSRSVRWTGSAWQPLDYVEETAVTGAANLTHANVGTKVGAAGEIVEGGITDESAGNSGSVHITSDGKVGVGTANPGAILSTGTSVAKKKIGVYDDGSSSFFGLGIGPGQIEHHADIGNHAFFANNVLVFHISAAGVVTIPLLPTAFPGAGTKQLWADPAAGFIVKWAP